MRLRSVLLTSLLAGTALVVPSPGASADAALPATTGFVVAGHGFGHGHGLSQYGARGAAIKKKTAAQILAFYYPGTKQATDTRSVKVLITADDDGSASVMPEDGLYVVDLTTGKKYPLPAGTQKAWRLRVVSGKTRVEFLNNGWHAYQVAKKTLVLTGSGQFRSATGALTLRTPDGHRRYRGGIRLVAGDVINVLSLDNYVKGVVPREMPALWEAAAVQSQAIAARTYAAYAITAHADPHYDLCDTSHCQVYGGVTDEHPNATKAVVATAQRILTSGGKPVFAQFSASNGGYTSKGGFSYLPGKQDPYDLTASNPYKNWHQTITDEAVEKAFPAIGALTKVQVLDRDSTGKRVTLIRLTGKKTSTTITGDRMRTIFGLRSTYFHLARP